MRVSKGFAIISVIIALIVISLMAVFFTNLVSTESVISSEKYKSIQAYYIAQGGLEYTLKKRTFPNYTINNMPLGEGSFSVYTSNTIGNKTTLISRGIVDNFKKTIGLNVINQPIGGEIKVDNTGTAVQGNLQTFTINSFSISNQPNRILIVGISIRNIGGQTVESVSYGSVNFSPANRFTWVYGTNNIRVEIWYLVNPTVGIANIQVTLSGPTRAVVGAVSFYGVDQTNPIINNASNSGNSPSPSVTINTIVNNAWVLDVLASRENVNLTFLPPGVQAYNLGTSAGANGVQAGGSYYGPVLTPSAVTMNWSLSSTQNWLIGAIVLKPSPQGSNVVKIESMREIYLN